MKDGRDSMRHEEAKAQVDRREKAYNAMRQCALARIVPLYLQAD